MNTTTTKVGAAGAQTGGRLHLRHGKRGSTSPGAWASDAPHWDPPDLADPFDRAIEWTLYGLLAFMPLALGAVHAWSELVVTLGAAALALLLAAKLVIRREARFVWSWTYLPVALFVALVAAQLVPLPAAVVGAISPATLKLRQELLGDLPNAGDALSKVTLSFYPHATARDLRLVLGAATVFVVVVNVFRRSKQIVRLLVAVAVTGGAVAALAVLQNVTGATAIFWSIYNGDQLATGGTFVNRNNFCQFMNLSIGAALAVLLVRLREVLGPGGRVLSRAKVYAGDSELRLAWAMGAVVVAGALSVILSMSRMGTVSLLAAGALTGVVLALRRDGGGARAWVLAPIALVLFAALLWFGFDRAYDRLATLRKLEQADAGSRWQTLLDLRPIFGQFPGLGIGSGAHETFYPMFDNHADAGLTAHVENEYAQVLEEAGGIGLGLIVLFVAMVWFAWWRGLGGTRVPVHPAALGLGFGLLAVMIHSAADFGQRLPAVAALSAVTCGVLVTLGQKACASRPSESSDSAARRSAATESAEADRTGGRDDGGSSRGRTARPMRVMAAAATASAFAWALTGAVSAARAESHWGDAERAEAHLSKYGWERAGEQELQRLLRHAADAARAEPANVHYAHEAAALRWRVVSTDPNRRDPRTGHLMLTQEDLDDVKEVVAALHSARRLCPTYGANLAVAGQLERFVLDQAEAGAAHIRQGYRLSRNNPQACFMAGYLDAVEGRMDQSLEKMRAAVRLSATAATFDDVVDVYLGQAGRPDLAVAVAGEDTARLMRVAEALQERSELRERAQRVKAEAMVRLRGRAARPDAPAAMLAQLADLCRKDGDPAAAVGYYRRALDRDYGQVIWRLEMARALAQTGDVKRAIAEAEICLRLRPRWAPAEKLVGELSVLPGAAPE